MIFQTDPIGLSGTRFTPPHRAAPGVGDFDGDGKADILWRNSATDQDVILAHERHHDNSPALTLETLDARLKPPLL